MSVFYAQLKHKIISFNSAEFNKVVEVNEEIKGCADFVNNMVADSGFKLLGYVELSIKVYFLIGSFGKSGKFVEFPMSIEVLSLLSKSNDNFRKLKLRKALCNNDIGKFGIEYSKFADEQFDMLGH
ncbi:hypothetical protein [Pseudomonas sp. HY7a-MNA-CIBAN-0227]|uniref:hypothetical protein n=1 Tax=Pseudomonas sp. HY7a-MNA-CIBAN-0227 TaxID=3140474 RepID=UPI003329AB99